MILTFVSLHGLTDLITSNPRKTSLFQSSYSLWMTYFTMFVMGHIFRKMTVVVFVFLSAYHFSFDITWVFSLGIMVAWLVTYLFWPQVCIYLFVSYMFGHSIRHYIKNVEIQNIAQLGMLVCFHVMFFLLLKFLCNKHAIHKYVDKIIDMSWLDRCCTLMDLSNNKITYLLATINAHILYCDCVVSNKFCECETVFSFSRLLLQ